MPRPSQTLSSVAPPTHNWQSHTPVALWRNVRRLTAPNPGLMTGPGTNSYLVGEAASGFIVIDPGPPDADHVQRLWQACADAQGRGGHIALIACTHSHADHAPAAPMLQALCAQRPPIVGLPSAPTARSNSHFVPDRALQAGEQLQLTGTAPHTLRAVFTPGHAANHVCFVLEEDGLLFSGDRHFGVGADQILSVRPSPAPGIDFAYAIHNADGAEVEQCGNGARCFARYVRDKGLSTQPVLRVQTQKALIELRTSADGQVTVDMGAPAFDPADLPFDAAGLQPQPRGDWQAWPLDVDSATVWVGALSMGNPHAVQLVDDVDSAPLEHLGPPVQQHVRFPRQVNAGFMQVLDRHTIRLRVYERGVGETLACGSGACAAVVAGMRWGLLDSPVAVHTRGGILRMDWDAKAPGAHVMMTGPAATVFEGEIELPDDL